MNSSEDKRSCSKKALENRSQELKILSFAIGDHPDQGHRPGAWVLRTIAHDPLKRQKDLAFVHQH